MSVTPRTLLKLRKFYLNQILNKASKNPKLGFYTLQQTINSLNKSNLVKNTIILREHELTLDLCHIIASRLETSKHIGIDVETTGLDCFLDDIHGVGLSDGKESNYYILKKGNESNLNKLIRLLNKNCYWVLHNTKFDRKFIKIRLGNELTNTLDTMLLAYLENPEQSQKLAHLAGKYLDKYPYEFSSLLRENLDKNKLGDYQVTINKDVSKIKLRKSISCYECEGTGKVSGKRKDTLKICPKCKGEKIILSEEELVNSIDYINLQALADYCAEDCHEAVNLYKKYQSIGLTSNELFREVDNPLEEVLANMELRGVRLDKYKLYELKEYIHIQLELILEDILTSLPIEHQWYIDYLNSPTKLLVLFNKLGVPLDSTDAETLKENENSHDFVKYLLEYRTLIKLKNTFVQPLYETACDAGVVRGTFNQNFTSTGRLSSSNPNLQNIPSGDKSELGKKLRQCFIPHNPSSQILCCDYSQFELRILAYLSGDELLIKAFKEERDIHTEVTKLIWGLDSYDGENPEHIKLRRYTKTLNFGLIYGMSSHRLSAMTGLDIDKCETIISTHAELLPKIWDYIETQYVKAISLGYTETMLGRRRYYEFQHSELRKLKGSKYIDYKELEDKKLILPQDKAKLRQAGNHPIQGTNADAIKKAMINIHRRGYHILLQIHDELVIEVFEGKENQTYTEVTSLMIGAIDLGDIPVKVSAKLAPSWGDAK